MTDPSGPLPSDLEPGSVKNGHILTAAGWLPLRRLPPGSPGPYFAGDLLDGNAYTGNGWVYVPVGEGAKVPHREAGTGPFVSTSPARSTGTGWVKALVIALLVIAGMALAGAVVDAASRNTGESKTPTSHPRTRVTTHPATPKPSASHLTADANTRYAAQMKRLGWTLLAEGLWGRFDGTSTDGYAGTWKFRVVSPTGCPNGVYLEANILDTSNTVIGFANDALPTLPANQQAVLSLTSTATGTVHPVPTKASCY